LLENPGPGFSDLNQVVLKAYEVSPRERCQSAAGFKASLEGLQEKLEISRRVERVEDLRNRAVVAYPPRPVTCEQKSHAKDSCKPPLDR